MNTTPIHKSRISKKRSDALKNLLQSIESLAVLTHNNPDPDAMTSALILKTIANNFGVKSTIFFSGGVNRAENKKMIAATKLTLQPYAEAKVKKYNAIAVVDCQIGMGNLISPPQKAADITFDHHVFSSIKKTTTEIQKKALPPFKEINVNIGATATLLMDYYLNYGFAITPKLANAYVYALHTETKYFSRDTHNKDMSVYKTVLPHCNLQTISAISHARKSPKYFKALAKVLNSYKTYKRVAYCNFGNIEDLEFVHELADLLASLEDIDVTVITAKHKGVGRISARSNNKDINVGISMKEAMLLLKNANGGGHPSMAAGIFHTSSATALKTFLKTHLKENL